LGTSSHREEGGSWAAGLSFEQNNDATTTSTALPQPLPTTFSR